MKLKYIVLTALALTLGATACSDWNEPEAREPQVNSFKERDPQGYADYTAALRRWKQTPHQISVALFDNAPEVSVSERDFLRSLPDSLDFVVMRHAARLTKYDRDDMKLVRTDFGTRVLYRLDCATATPDKWSAAAAAVKTGQFDGVVIASSATPDASLLDALVTAAGSGATLMFEGSPSVLTGQMVPLFSHFIIDATSAKDAYDIDMAVRLAALAVDPASLLLCVAPSGQITDHSGVTRNAPAGAAVAAMTASPALAGIAITDISADYYDADIIYKRTRGAIQTLNPAQ